MIGRWRGAPRAAIWVMLSALASTGCSSHGPNKPRGHAETASDPAVTGAPRPSAAPAQDVEPQEMGETAQADPQAAPAEPAWQPRPEDIVEPHQALEHPERLAYFYDALARVDDGEKDVVRVVHMGASMIGADDLPGVLRGRFQTRFGDGGAGLVLLKRYMANYKHNWVRLESEGWDHCYLAYKCKGDGRYGLGGTTFWSDGGAWTTMSTRKHELGDEVSKFELWYVARPGGGRIGLKVDNMERHVVNTRAETLEDRYYPIEVEQGAHRIRVSALGGGRTRAYGVVMETDGPGIVWDQFSKLGVFVKKVLWWDADHLAGHMAHRDPDLIVFTYGGNDTRRVASGKLTREQYVQEFSDVIAHVRRGKPEASCLVTSMTDRGKSLQIKITPEHVETIVSAQREAADEQGCAFFDTYTAMGGGGSLEAWKNRSPPLAAKDLKHLNHRGRVLLGGWMYDAIVTGYVAHRTNHPNSGP